MTLGPAILPSNITDRTVRVFLNCLLKDSVEFIKPSFPAIGIFVGANLCVINGINCYEVIISEIKDACTAEETEAPATENTDYKNAA